MADGRTFGTRLGQRTKTFNARYDWMGPVMAVLSAWYFLAQIVVGWVFNPPSGSHPAGPQYSFITNTISDLGNTACGQYGGSRVCSPRHLVMDVSFGLLGAAMAVGSLLVYREFTNSALRRERGVALIGFVLLAAAGVGAIMVGLFPENVNGALHVTGATMAIGVANVGILMLGLVLVSIPDGMRHFMVVSASVSLVAAVSFGMKHHFGLGAGGIERIAAYPESVWLIMFGLYITRDHYRRGLTTGLRWTSPSAHPATVTPPPLSVRSIPPPERAPT